MKENIVSAHCTLVFELEGKKQEHNTTISNAFKISAQQVYISQLQFQVDISYYKDLRWKNTKYKFFIDFELLCVHTY